MLEEGRVAAEEATILRQGWVHCMTSASGATVIFLSLSLSSLSPFTVRVAIVQLALCETGFIFNFTKKKLIDSNLEDHHYHLLNASKAICSNKI